MKNKRRTTEGVQTICLYFGIRVAFLLVVWAIFKNHYWSFGLTPSNFRIILILKALIIASSVSAYYAAKKFSGGEHDKAIMICCIISAFTLSQIFIFSFIALIVDFLFASLCSEKLKREKAIKNAQRLKQTQSKPSGDEQLKEAHPELIDYAKQLKWLFDREEKLKGTIAELQKQLSIVQDRASIEQQLAEETQKLAETRKDIERLQNIISEIRSNYKSEIETKPV